MPDSRQPSFARVTDVARDQIVRDPLGQVLRLGERQVRVGLLIGLFGALLSHGVIGVRAAGSLNEMADFAQVVNAFVRDKFKTQLDIDLDEPPPPPPPPPPEPAPPEPEPPKTETPPPVAKTDEPPPPPAAAQAGKVLTQEPDPNEPVDLTADSIAVGNADRYAGGITSSSGTSDKAVRDVRARPNGVGTAPPGPVKEGAAPKDLSRTARAIASGSWNDCPFPAEADMEGIDHALVTLSVTVGPDGRAKSVAVIKDPGNGFGRQARQCAMRKSYEVGLDRMGQPTSSSTPPFSVRFTR
jgi:protein TonB